MLDLPLPSKDQVGAAQELYKDNKMEYWRLSDDILGACKNWDENIFEKAATLVKVTLVNAFYKAGCYDVDAMTSWMVAQKPSLWEQYQKIVIDDVKDREDKLIELVKRIANKETKQAKNDIAQQANSNNRVFASKFAHFFINGEDFPIFDQYATMMVNFHLGRKSNEENSPTNEDPYASFYKDFFQLKQYLELRDSDSYPTKNLDHYLWLAGQYVTRRFWDFEYGLRYRLQLYADNLFKNTDNPNLKQLFPPTLLDKFNKELLYELPKWKDSIQKMRNQEKKKMERERIKEQKK